LVVSCCGDGDDCGKVFVTRKNSGVRAYPVWQ
jgi:hypothetical protein